MLKSFLLAALLFVASTLLIAQATFGSPLPQETHSPETAQTQSSEAANTQSPESADAQSPESADTLVDVPGKKAPVVSARRSTYSQPPHPYNNAAIRRFDEELYGEGN